MRKLLLAISIALTSCVSQAQTPGTGAYAYASFDSHGFDSVNLGNLNTRFAISIVNRVGRGLPFNYLIQYEGLIWSPVPYGSTTEWANDPTWGFNGRLNGTGYIGYLTHQETRVPCASNKPGIAVPSYSGFQYHDQLGLVHSFPTTITESCPGGTGFPTISGGTEATDGSGYNLLSETQVEALNGVVLTPGASSSVDPNGNEITFNGTGTFTDTLGATALTIAGSGPVTYTYPVTLQANGATTASTTLTYKSYTVRTNFGCPGIVEYGSTTVDLVDRITLADGSYYAFTYEGTPGATDGAVTARIATITLPTGGVISYTYTGGCNGSGINADGTVSGLTRTSSDGTRTYTRTTNSSISTSTTLQDEKGNQSVLTFSDSSGSFYETHRKVYQGAAGGSLLLERFTCYNGSSANCDGLAVTPPFTEVDTTESYNGGSQALTKTTLASTGELITELAKYSGSTLLESTSYTYNSLGEVLSTTTTDGSGNTVAVSTYGYDETAVTATSGIPQHTTATSRRGNLTSSHVYTAGSTALTTTTSYYDTGQPISTVTPGPQTTQYGYDSTQTFRTSTTLPTPSSGVGLSTSATYNTASASLLTSTGMNSGQTTSINQYDVFLRPTSVTLPNGGSVTYSYTSPVQETVTQSLNASTGEVSESAVFLDPYGRNSRVAVYNGQSSNPWYQADSCYDQSGFVKFRATAYQGQGGSSSIVCSGSGTAYQYDALGRVTQAANNDGTQSITYNNRAVETTDVNGVQRITQYDLLGRMSGVCEISSNPMGGQSPTPCGMDISGTGYVTSYAYNLAAHTVTITQGSQQRVEQTDEAGEVIAVTEPERGSTTYSYGYNSTGLQVVRMRPKANQTSATTLTHTTTQYDSLGRVVSISYDDGITPAKSYYYDTLPTALQWSQSPAYPKGQLVGTASGSGTTLTRSELSYDISGNVLSMWQCAPSICGGASQQSRGATQLSYDLGGNLTYESDPASGGITYGRTPAGEISSMSSTYNSTGNPPTLVSNVVNTPFGPTSYALGNGLNQVTTYDTLGRSNGSWVCNGSSAAYCTNGSQIYGNTDGYQGSRVSSTCDTVLNQCQSNGYDEFNRLTSITDNSHNNGDIGSYTYTYDRYGNRLTQTSQSGGPSPSYSYDNGNHLMSAGYDAAGNEVSDGISHTYTYDAEGNVIQVDSGNTAQYVYDAFNRRVSVQTSAGSYEYVFDPSGHRLSTWAVSSNSGIEGRIYMNGGQIAFRAEDGTTYFQHMSPLGTVRMRTNYLGQVAATESSLPYGDNLLQNGSTYADQDNQEYAGQDYDSESTSSHAQFRQYSSTQGRWMSPDPYDGSYDDTNPQSLNRYSYALNNPLIYVDPTGTDCQYIYNSDTGAVGCEDGGEPDVGPGGNPPSPQTPNNTINVTVVLSPYGYVTTLLAMDTAALDNFGPPVNPAGWPSPVLSANFTGNVGGAGAPNNGPTKSGCLGQALKGSGNGTSLALDAAGIGAGFLPGGGLVTGSASAARTAFAVQAGLTAASTVNSVAYQNGPGIIAGILGGQVALTTKLAESIAVDVGKALPVVGVAVSAGALLYDGYQTYQAYSSCLTGVHQ